LDDIPLKAKGGEEIPTGRQSFSFMKSHEGNDKRNGDIHKDTTKDVPKLQSRDFK